MSTGSTVNGSQRYLRTRSSLNFSLKFLLYSAVMFLQFHGQAQCQTISDLYEEYQKVSLEVDRLLASKKFDKADELIDRHLKRNPDFHGYNVLKSYSLAHQGELEKAKQFLAIASQSKVYDSFEIDSARVHSYALKYKEAIPLYIKHKQNNPDDFFAIVELADCYEKAGEYAKAFTEYKASLEKTTDDFLKRASQHCMAKEKCLLKEYPEALAMINSVITNSKHVNSEDYMLRVKIVVSMGGDLKSCVPDLEQVLRNDPNDKLAEQALEVIKQKIKAKSDK